MTMDTVRSVGLSLLLCGSLMALAADSSQPDPTELLAQAARFPILTVPRITAEPVIDGTVHDDEWAAAALLPNTMSTEARRHEGVAPRYRTRMWLQYTPEALYVAMRADYPDWSPTPIALSTKRDQTTGAESHFDLFINPTWSDDSECWHLCGNANGTIFDRHLGDASLGRAWNPDITYKARILERGWEAEYRIPFAALGKDAPVPGTYWRANLFFTRSRPTRTMSTWSPWAQWRQYQGTYGYGWLRFGADDTAVRFEQGVESADRLAPSVRVTGGTRSPVRVAMTIRRRTDPFEDAQPGMLMNLAKWHSERDVGGAAFLGISTDKIIAAALQPFADVGVPLARTVEPADGALLELPVTADLGEYMVQYALTRDQGDTTEILAAGALSYRVLPPLAIDLKPALLTADLLEVTVDYANMKDLASAVGLQLTVVDTATDEEVFTERQEISGAEPRSFRIQGNAIPMGDYTITASVHDAKQNVLADMARAYSRPPLPDWWTDPVGESPLVPAPWTPVALRESATPDEIIVAVWGREYRFHGLPVPSTVITTPTRYSTGEPEQAAVSVLHAPMALRMQTPTGPAAFHSEPIRVTEQTPEKVILTSRSTTDHVVITGTTTIEFDGFVRVDLNISPRTDAAVITALDFAIPFKHEYATLFGNFKNAPGPATERGRQLGFLPTLPWRSPVHLAQSVGTDRFGLQWVCDSTRDWRQKRPNESLELRRVGASVEEIFHFIDYPITLRAPLNISFGLMATPVKPLPDKWGQLRVTSSSFRGPDVDDADAVSYYRRRAAWVKPDVEIDHNPGWSGTPWYPYAFQDLAAEEAMRKRVDLCHEVGVRYCPHSGWQAISTLIPEWKTFGKEMGIEPETETIGKTVFACYHSPYSKFTAYQWDHHARRVGIDGVKADTMFPQTPCASLYHDCGWYDENGKLWPSVNIFATRDFFKRLYRVFHGSARKDGLTNAAQTGVPIAPICSFTDIVNISEGAPYYKARSLKEGYPQDLVRTLMVGAPYGVITIHDMKGDPLNANQRIAALLVAGADPRFMALSYHYLPGYAKLPPGKHIMASPYIDIWEAWNWIDRGGEAIWMPHWENRNAVRLNRPTIPDGSAAELFSSLYVQPGKRILLIVTNYEIEPATTEVSLNLAELGFDPDEELQAEDAVTRVPLSITKGRLPVGIRSERYRIIRIWKGEEPRYAPHNLGPNLLPEGDFEKEALPRPVPPYAVRDVEHAATGKASLRLDRSRLVGPAATDTLIVPLNAPALSPGRYILQGFVRMVGAVPEGTIDPWGKQPYQAPAEVRINAPGTEFDPPAWTSYHAGRFMVEEATPGWEPLCIVFDVTEDHQPVTIELRLGQARHAWFDGLTLNREECP
ncbi:MAG: hypothetical protein HQ523_04350 [Lentisphaerae bacterium]|nr:hypothetical protein [Lentisphaerota bacterium]